MSTKTNTIAPAQEGDFLYNTSEKVFPGIQAEDGQPESRSTLLRLSADRLLSRCGARWKPFIHAPGRLSQAGR